MPEGGWLCCFNSAQTQQTQRTMRSVVGDNFFLLQVMLGGIFQVQDGEKGEVVLSALHPVPCTDHLGLVRSTVPLTPPWQLIL